MATTEDKFIIFHHNAATLKKISSSVTAIQLWRTEIVRNYDRIHTLKSILLKLRSVIHVPSTIENVVRECTERVKQSLVNWLEFHFLRVFHPQVKTYGILKYYDLISWRYDCSIDFEKSAKNLMSCAELNQIIKYKLACLYCFEDEIRELWPDVQSNYEIDGITLKYEPLLHYWTFRMDTSDSSMETEYRDSVEQKFIEGDVITTWSALLYFWTHSKPDERLNRTVNMIERCSVHCAKYLIPLLTESQVEMIVQRTCEGLMRALARSPNDVEYTLQMWHYMRNMITTEHFVCILDEIGKLNSAHGHLHSLLYDIWRDAPDNFIHYASHKYLDGIIALLHLNDSYPLKNLSRDMRLLNELLSYKSPKMRNYFWSTTWRDLIEGASPASLDQLMKLCHLNDQDIINFKKSNLIDYDQIQIYCESLVCKGYFDELNEFLNFCSSDRSIVAGLKKKIVWSKGYIEYCVNYFEDPLNTRAFEKFVEDVYPEPRHRINLHCQVITSFWNNGHLRKLIAYHNILSIKNLLRSFLTRGNDLKKAKKNFKQICYRILSGGKFKTFNAHEWDEVLLWCMNDDKLQVEQFKRSLPLDGIYRILFGKWIKVIQNSLSNHPNFEPEDFSNFGIYDHYDAANNSCSECDSDIAENRTLPTSLESRRNENVSSTDKDFEDSEDDDDDDEDDDEINAYNGINTMDRFNVLNDFLIWYFSSKAKIDQFKIQKIKQYSVPPLSEILACDEERLIKIVLDWLFNGETKRVALFRALLNR